jgi:23S rRNA (guanosine2251-2'-O)-methyltransferase
MEKKYNDRRPRNDRNNNGAKRYPDARGYGDRRDRYRDNANDDREIFDMNAESEDEGVVVGRNAVRELLKSGRDIDKIFVQRGEREGSIVVLAAQATERNIPLVEVDKVKLDKMTAGANHQGIVAMAAQKQYCTVEDILAIAAERGEKPLIVISDGITDPYNLGALIRCAEGAGAHGLIIPKRRAVGLTPVVSKASAGAIEHLAVAKVSNIAQTVTELQEKGVWVYAAEAGGQAYYETDFRGPCALVFGSEGNGVSHIVKEKSDQITSIPMYGEVNSLNVSTAAAVILCEASKQHHLAEKQ